MRLSWNALLFGLKAKRLEGDIYSVQVTVLGDCEIVPTWTCCVSPKEG